MFVQITNTPRDYAWGSERAITDLLGQPASTSPQAELWLGAHPGSPSVIVDPAQTGGARTLTEWIANDPERASGSHGHLPYLLKILSAERPLSLQAHPTLSAARAGFERENAEGLAPDAPNRNYKDPLHKPEVIFALSEKFEALCGFRPVSEIHGIITLLKAADARAAVPEPELLSALESQLRGDTHEALRTAVEWLLSGGEEVLALVRQVTSLVGGDGSGDEGAAEGLLEGEFGAALATVRDLAAEYPGDPGVVISLLLNRVTLNRGEALFLPAGNIHAYLKGLGVELMAASDNVLRGGLTPKYIDVPELLSVLVFDSLPVPYLNPGHPSAGVEVYQPDVIDFELVRVTPGLVDARYLPLGPAIVICTSGGVTVSSATGSAMVAHGASFFVTPDEGELTFSGEGELFLAGPGAA
ncbi:mannose-6-phosphate isomerase, class I [Subtercola sp. PAMC28395]|uniref:mannose-6-phosphate isomerase, class I n=1 Tax=Subtercola sp. PAMC28395 TaxID=2846775 RepID=UPI001C0AB21F|nr:mannose-6-phosphate isomerase, class I [Subtercola sp. PAMC28395]QWT25045.1 mannose-6-phosphate isomerase, class I [Subtercola sp. PAMC28395]